MPLFGPPLLSTCSSCPFVNPIVFAGVACLVYPLTFRVRFFLFRLLCIFFRQAKFAKFWKRTQTKQTNGWREGRGRPKGWGKVTVETGPTFIQVTFARLTCKQFTCAPASLSSSLWSSSSSSSSASSSTYRYALCLLRLHQPLLLQTLKIII